VAVKNPSNYVDLSEIGETILCSNRGHYGTLDGVYQHLHLYGQKLRHSYCEFVTPHGFFRFGKGYISNWGDIRYPVWTNLVETRTMAVDNQIMHTTEIEKKQGIYYYSTGNCWLKKVR
jgi:hypothetical protein